MKERFSAKRGMRHNAGKGEKTKRKVFQGVGGAREPERFKQARGGNVSEFTERESRRGKAEKEKRVGKERTMIGEEKKSLTMGRVMTPEGIETTPNQPSFL